MIYVAWHHDNITQPATTGDQKDKAQSLLIYHDIRQSHITRVSLCHSYYIPPINLYGCVVCNPSSWDCRYILRQSWCCRCQYLWWGSYVVRLGRGHGSMTCQYWTAWLRNSYWRSDKNLSNLTRRNRNYSKYWELRSILGMLSAIFMPDWISWKLLYFLKEVCSVQKFKIIYLNFSTRKVFNMRIKAGKHDVLYFFSPVRFLAR